MCCDGWDHRNRRLPSYLRSAGHKFSFNTGLPVYQPRKVVPVLVMLAMPSLVVRVTTPLHSFTMPCNMRIRRFLLTSALILFLAILAQLIQGQEAKPATTAQLDPTAILLDAKALYRKGSFDQSLARYNEVLKADPHSGDAY